MNNIIRLACLVTALAIVPITTQAGQRLALVVGNSDYAEAPLANPVNDATDIAERLRRLGFETELVLNADQRTFVQSIREFSRRLAGDDDKVGLFYYAGHGVEVRGANYLVPIGADIRVEEDVEFEAVNVGRVLAGMENARNGLNLVVLDACRNNPYKSSFRSASRGLARVNAPAGSLILYSAQPGNVAADGSGRNGTFTKYLLESIEEPGLTIEQVFKNTARGVQQETGGQQTPWVEGVILTDFYFVEEGAPQNEPVQTAKAAPAETAVGTTPSSSQDAVGDKLQECRLHFDANRLTSGAVGNAFDCYRDVLAKDPGNVEALKGVKDIEDTYANWARAAVEEGNAGRARNSIEKLKSLNPEHRAIGELTSAIVKLEQNAEKAEARNVVQLRDQCERAAAYWVNNALVTPYDKVDPDSAVPACERAVKANPSDGDLKAYLCRALQTAERYDDATRVCTEAIEQGSAVGMWSLGNMFYLGLGKTQDFAQASVWYQQASEKGYAPAQRALGTMYQKGQGVQQDFGQALRLHSEAAGKGEALSQYQLGVMYAEGLGVDTDFAQALNWHLKSAAQGVPGAQAYLGYLYENGKGVTQDVNQALSWYRKSAAYGNEYAKKAIARLEAAPGPAQTESTGQTSSSKQAAKKTVSTNFVFKQTHSSACVLWGCKVTIEAYVNGQLIKQLKPGINDMIENSIWNGELEPGDYDVSLRVKYRGPTHGKDDQLDQRVRINQDGVVILSVHHGAGAFRFRPSLSVNYVSSGG